MATQNVITSSFIKNTLFMMIETTHPFSNIVHQQGQTLRPPIGTNCMKLVGTHQLGVFLKGLPFPTTASDALKIILKGSQLDAFCP